MLSWIGPERLVIGGVPSAATLAGLAEQGVTHVVNCRASVQTWYTRDLAAEHALFGTSRVVHAPMWDHGLPQRRRLWSAAACFAAEALADDPAARVLVHCQAGRRRSVMMAYAVLRLRGHSAASATGLIRAHHPPAEFVPAYLSSVDRWLAAGAAPVGRLRIR
ncbi:MAG: dual specificity protein phosphatase family protein [Micromonosporaceae bacterium]|nr:dual specificity protein phosphatase family protein [Micromonosporaceae bacterium]